MIKKFLISIFVVCCLFLPAGLFAAEENAIFAGGCFWCLEHDLEDLPGIINAQSGYSGGEIVNPTYKRHKGHQEVVFVQYDDSKISYEKLLRAYWRNIDPLDGEGQFCDRGDSYRPVIFTSDESQKQLAELSIKSASQELNLKPEKIKVQIRSTNKFWLAEDYHQNYASNNNLKYNFYRYSCGRDKKLLDVWGDKAGTSDAWD